MNQNHSEEKTPKRIKVCKCEIIILSRILVEWMTHRGTHWIQVSHCACLLTDTGHTETISPSLPL